MAEGAKGPRLRMQVRVVPFLGPGKMMLLDGIERLGSITAAARSLGMSYGRAWRLIEAMNIRFNSGLVSKAPGGTGGGGACLTETGKTVLRLYRAIERKSQTMFAAEVDALQKLLAPNLTWRENAPPRGTKRVVAPRPGLGAGRSPRADPLK